MGFSVGPAQTPQGLAPNAIMVGKSEYGNEIDMEQFRGKDGRIDLDAYKKALAAEEERSANYFKDVGTSPRPMMPGGYQLKSNSVSSSGY